MRLVLSGGGTGGHIVPNIALIQGLKARYRQPGDLELLYIGSRHGMEKKMMSDMCVPYRGIFCGKLRRYFSLLTFLDFFTFIFGIIQAMMILRRFKPTAIFCKGGYVSLPVAIAGGLLKMPVFAHESDLKPGLSNRIAARYAQKILVSFEETKAFFPAEKVVVTGNPVRMEILEGDAEIARKSLHFETSRPVLLIMGGSQGAGFINDLTFRTVKELTKRYQIIHICGEGKVNDELRKQPHYKAFPYVDEELKHYYALANIIITRAGANALSEIELLGKPSILIPLGTDASRGDQIDNAHAFARNHPCFVLQEGKFDDAYFLATIQQALELKPDHHRRNESAAARIISYLEHP